MEQQPKPKHRGHAKVYLRVGMALLIFTGITVWFSYYNFGDWNVFVAMLVATTKGALVCLYFMHLKYDNRVNQVVFCSAFIFLAIFVGLTGSDEWFRQTEKAPVVAEAPAVDVSRVLTSSPDVLKQGKALYDVQCSVCHGSLGKGDGPGGAAMNPKPRDFTSGYWKFGGGLLRVTKTITVGSPGTPMPGFANLSLGERLALAHYIRSFGSKQEEDKPEEVEAIKKELGWDKVGQEAVTAPVSGPKLPIAFVMKQLEKSPTTIPDKNTPEATPTGGIGEVLYQQNCLRCHGVKGRGGIPMQLISTNPAVYLRTRSFAESKGEWVTNQEAFRDLVSKGLPGRSKPGIAHFSSEEWTALYQYVKSMLQR